MSPTLLTILIAAAENEEFVPPSDWRGAIALPAGIIIFFGAVFLLLKSNLGTRRAYLVEATCFFGFMTVLSLFWAFGAPGTPQFTGPQSLPGQPVDLLVPKWVAFAGSSNLAQEEFGVVQQFPQGFEPETAGEEELGPDEAADEGDLSASPDSAVSGADEVGTFFRETRGGIQLVGDDWVQDGPPLAATAETGQKVVGTTYAKPFALDDDGEVPTDGAGDPLFSEDRVGQPIPADFEVPPGVDDDVAQLVTPERFTGFAYFDQGFPLLPSLVMIVLSIAGFVLHVLLLGWDENREKERTVDELVIEREPVGASR